MEGQYHSVYDDLFWFTHFQDSGFGYGLALAQVGGVMMMRLADATILPFKFTNLADTIRTYISEIKELDANQRAFAKELDTEIDEGVFQATADPRTKMNPPEKEIIPPYLNFAPLDNAADELMQAADAYEKALGLAASQGPAGLNADLIKSERMLSDALGLPNRPWYKNLIYAPGLYTGYGVKTLPGVREAIERKRWNEADWEISRVAKALEALASVINDAKAKLATH